MLVTFKQSIRAFYILMLFFLLIPCAPKAQKKEIGGGIGTLFYTGDLARSPSISNTTIGATVFLRNNINDHLSVKISYTGGFLEGSDANPIDIFAAQRSAPFRVFLSEFSASMEYHFLDFKNKNSNIKWSPYFLGGIGLFGMAGVQDKNATYGNVQIGVPLGIGFKYIITPKWIVGLEIGARGTFFDYIDNISQGDVYNKNYQYGNPFDNDKYYFVGLTVSHVLYKVQCPTLGLKPTFRRH